MRILITGAKGFIGSALVKELNEITTHEIYGTEEDVTDLSSVDSIFRFQPHYVYHLVTKNSDKLSHFVRMNTYSNNFIGTANIVDACVNSGVKKLIFMSSAAVYQQTFESLTEESKLDPETPYGISKLASELDIKAASKKFGLKYTIFRPHIIFGEGQIYKNHRNVVAMFIHKILNDEVIPIYGNGEQNCCFSYITDIVQTLYEASDNKDSDNQTINIRGVCCSLNSLINVIESYLGKKAKVEYHNGFNNLNYRLDEYKAQAIFAIHRVPFESAIKYTIDWYKTQDFKKQVKTDIEYEITKDLPENWK